MEIVDKIRAEIAQHMNEIERLNTALSVIESMSGKSFAAKPMITIRGTSSQTPPPAKIESNTGKPKRKSPDLSGRFSKERQPTEVIRDAVLAQLMKQPMNAGELKRALPEKLFATRGHNALGSLLHEMKKGGLIGKEDGPERRYFPAADPIVVPPSSEETEAA